MSKSLKDSLNHIKGSRRSAPARKPATTIIDSLSHPWSDEGGILDQTDKLSAGGNRFTVWAKLTPQHRSLVNGMLNSPAHIIATVRSKQDYAIGEDDRGKKTVKKWGSRPCSARAWSTSLRSSSTSTRRTTRARARTARTKPMPKPIKEVGRERDPAVLKHVDPCATFLIKALCLDTNATEATVTQTITH